MPATAKRPNVVVFFTDQQRWDCSSLHGNPLDLMPNFDRLAQEQTHLANCFTCQPVCGPARSCLQTGQYATTTGVWKNGNILPTDRKNLATCFNEAGYHTGYIGKWHLAGIKHNDRTGGGIVPKDKRGGYQHWLGVEALEFSEHEYKTVLYDNDDKPVTLPGYRSDAVADAGIRYIDEHQDEPFFLLMSFIEPHHQNDKDDYPAPDGYRERYAGKWCPPDLAALPSWSTTQGQEGSPTYNVTGGTTQQHLGGYYGMVKRLDEAFGRVCDSLKSLDIMDDTIIMFISDHGCHFKTRNSEYKRSCHESSIRVPSLLSGPGFEGKGRFPGVVSLVDLPPTLLDACGLDIPDTMQGHSMMPVLRGETSDWQEEILVQISESHIGRAVRTKRWKYAVESVNGTEDQKGSATQFKEAFLYDLHHDPYELCNLINQDSHAKVCDVMRERLLRRMDQAGEAKPEIVLAQRVHGGQRHVRDEEVNC
ncbi:MAG TPA: arylsulfatase [Phycisphaerales bacterium]|nr:arylsulfatase [Phycisphaerales bacterium]|tara:strand:- start:5474 stop:6904 length:1431 start_codon:yes stop_codon:yes gene_type:complete